MAVQDWNTNDTLNGTIEGENIAEGSLPPDVNDVLRKITAAIRTFYNKAYRKNENIFIQAAATAAPAMQDGDILLYYTP